MSKGVNHINKMKTETQIAKQQETLENGHKKAVYMVRREHNETCKRWKADYLENLNKLINNGNHIEVIKFLQNTEKDLRDAVKVHEK